MSFDESTFHATADRTLMRLMTAIERDLGDDLDVDIEGEVLSIDLPEGGQYIINKNDALKQIWLSSPSSGAWHFEWNQESGTWLSTRHDHVELDRLLTDELERVTGTRVSL